MMENVDIDGRQIRTEIVVAEHGTLSNCHCRLINYNLVEEG